MKTTKRNNRISRDIAVCALIVFVSIVLHSLSLPVLYAAPGARDEYRTESGLPYLSEMDSYLYCRLTEELAEGSILDYTLRHDRGEDPYISANATGEEGDVVMGLPILGATVYKLLSWIPGVTPYGVIFWLAPFIASLTAIPVFFFVSRRLRWFGERRASTKAGCGSSGKPDNDPGCDSSGNSDSDPDCDSSGNSDSDPDCVHSYSSDNSVAARSGRLGGLIAAMLIVTAAAFSWHTHAGFYDTDLGLSLLPCTFLLCYAETLLAKDRRSRIAWGCGSGLALCALSTFWRAYYAYFCIGAAAAFCAVVALLLARLFRKMRLALEETDASTFTPLSLTAIPGALIGLAAQVLFCLLIRGRAFFEDIAGIVGNVSGSLANGDASFPDAGRFVSELQPIPMLSTGYGEGKLDRFLNGFAAYAEGILNKLGAWPVLIVTAATAVYLVYRGCLIVFTGQSTLRTKAGVASAAVSSGDASLSTDLLTTAVFLGVWLACGIFIMMKGSRFLTIPVLPVGIVCGLGAGLLHLYLNKPDDHSDEAVEKTSSHNKLARALSPRNLIYIGIIVLAVAGWAFAVRPEFGTIPCIAAGAVALAIGVALFIFRRAALANLLAVTLMFSPCMACAGGSYGAIPDGSDTLQSMCDAIREHTEPDAAIASWWDYGYFYEYAAKRLTLGDGGNFNSEWNYWLGQALMTDDITLTKGICRMLASCGLDACHLLMDRYETEGTDYARRATSVLKTILPLSRDEAYSVLTGTAVTPGITAAADLSGNLPAGTPAIVDLIDSNRPTGLPVSIAERDVLDSAAANELLALTHPADPRPIYLVLSEDMLHKVGAIGTFGRWDFTGNNPSTPYIRRGSKVFTIEPGQTAEITFMDSGYTLYVERGSDGQFTSCSLRDANGGKPSVTVRVVPFRTGEDNAAPETMPLMTDEPMPRFRNSANGSFTVYLREDGPSAYRCLLCDTYAADYVIVRGFMVNGNTLFYRIITELPENDGTLSLKEVSVWELGR